MQDEGDNGFAPEPDSNDEESETVNEFQKCMIKQTCVL